MTQGRSALQLTFTVERYLSGVRIDSFLQKHLRNYTTWRLSRMVSAGVVMIDAIRADAAQRVFRGQSVTIRLIEPPDKLLEPEPIPLSIVYEDPWLLVIDKPAGLVAHPVGAYQSGTLCNAIQFHLDQQTSARSLLRPGIVHRLDRMTSGLIVVTKDHLSHRILSRDFQRGRPGKTYHALVSGDPPFNHRIIDDPIGTAAAGGSVLMSASPDARRPKNARTDAAVVKRWDSHALVKCQLHTGRNHQIRVHMAHIGHPVLGDHYYGSPHHSTSKNADTEDHAAHQRHALHAAELQIEHPILKTKLAFRSAPPGDFWATVPRVIRP